MSARVLIVKNNIIEGPGLLRDVLQENHVSADVVELERGDRIPSPTQYGAMIVLGGLASAYDTDEVMAHQIERVREAIERNVPYLGICLGHHVLVKAAGGDVVPMPAKEIGFTDPNGKPYTVDITEAGESDPLLDGIESGFRVFQLHGDESKRSSNVALLGTAPGCEEQIVRAGRRLYGLQMHVEIVPEVLAVWLAQHPDLEERDPQTMLRELGALFDEYAEVGRKLFTNFLSIANLTTSVDITEEEHARNV